MIVRDGELFLVDFGLGESSQKIENKAIDLRVFKAALGAKHNKVCKICFDYFKDAYLKIMGKDGEKVFERLKEIEKRGRYALRED
jgi:TP53 regulating kinase-like protein